MKLKGIELKGTYKVEFGSDWFEVYDEKDNQIYIEFSDGYWQKKEFDENDNNTYYEDRDGNWCKMEHDEKGNEIYYEDSEGIINDNRAKELSVGEIEKLLGYKIKIKGEREWENT